MAGRRRRRRSGRGRGVVELWSVVRRGAKRDDYPISNATSAHDAAVQRHSHRLTAGGRRIARIAGSTSGTTPSRCSGRTIHDGVAGSQAPKPVATPPLERAAAHRSGILIVRPPVCGDHDPSFHPEIASVRAWWSESSQLRLCSANPRAAKSGFRFAVRADTADLVKVTARRIFADLPALGCGSRSVGPGTVHRANRRVFWLVS